MLNHPWDITPREAIALQRQFAGMVRVEPLAAPVRWIAGVDCSFVGTWRREGRVIAAAVLWDVRRHEVVARANYVGACTFPYVPGLLSFREAPAVIEAIGRLPQRPGVVMIDGQGLAHPRGFGIACHVGVYMDVPTIGVAKSRLCGQHRDPGPLRGSRRQLMFEGRCIGAVLRTQDNVKPLYVSAGHRVTLAQAIILTLRAATHVRLPEPTRWAHHEVTMIKKDFCKS